ncbi:MAG: hypothetical protein HQK62_07465, partial [Desulfamplus sp.]|nr:hypothetical protein [Desulfamplus sp.]
LENTTNSMVVVGDVPKITPLYAYVNQMESFEFDVTGGIPPYTITAGAGTFESIGSGKYRYTAPETKGIYPVTAYDSRGLVAQLTVETGSSQITLSPSNLVLGSGESNTVTINNGKPPYTIDAEMGNISWTGQAQFRYEAPEQRVRGSFSIVVTDANGLKASAMVSLNSTGTSCVTVDEAVNLNLPCLYMNGKPVEATLNYSPKSGSNDLFWTMGYSKPAEANEFPAVLKNDNALTIPCLEILDDRYYVELVPAESDDGKTIWRLGNIQAW